MAIGVAEGAAEIASTANVATYDFGAVVLSANAVAVIMAFARGSVDPGDITNVSGDPLTWTKKAGRTWPAGDNSHSIYVFWAVTPASPSSSVYRVDLTGDNAIGCGAVMFQFTDADLLIGDPIKQVVTNDSTGTPSANANGTFAMALDTNNGYAAAWMGALGSGSSAPPASWFEIADVGFISPASNISGAWRAGGETGNTVTFTNASTVWGFAAVEVYAAGTGPALIGRPSPRSQSQLSQLLAQ